MPSNGAAAAMDKGVAIFEYVKAANPQMPIIPVLAHPPELHQSGSTREIPFDLSKSLEVPYAATSPNLYAAFLRVCTGESIETSAVATSQAFYVIRGSGRTRGGGVDCEWSEGDLFTVPSMDAPLVHEATGGEHGGAAIYWVHDGPLMKYLGVAPSEKKFEPTMYKKERMLAEVEAIKAAPGADKKNRVGILLAHANFPQTKTLTHTLWSLLNTIGPNQVQKAHRHNSVALDMAVFAAPGKVYTLMGENIDSNGQIVNPIRCDWITGGVFVTPPGWWHSHHNESDEVAWVLPMQDAGLYTHQRTLDIRFVDNELHNLKRGMVRGTSFEDFHKLADTDLNVVSKKAKIATA